MPNWCHNTLTVEGSRRDLERFSKRASRPQHEEDDDGAPLYFSSLVPEPEEREREDFDWYSWRIVNWGSKWEPNFSEDVLLAFGSPGSDPGKGPKGLSREGDLSYKFDTAWSPPSAWVEQVSRRFPSLRFTLSYGELGCDFAGREVFINGRVIEAEDLDVREVLKPSEMWF